MKVQSLTARLVGATLLTFALAGPATAQPVSSSAPVLQTPNTEKEILQNELSKLRKEVQYLEAVNLRNTNEASKLTEELRIKTAECDQFERIADESKKQADELLVKVSQMEAFVATQSSRLQDFVDAQNTMVSNLTTAVFQAKFAEAMELRNAASDALGGFVNATALTRGNLSLEKRDRFTLLSPTNQIIVTDFPGEIEKSLSFLTELDEGWGAAMSRPESDAKENLMLEPKSLNYDQIQTLLRGSQVQLDSLPNTSTYLLRGSREQIEAASALIQKADRPIPQIRMQAWLVGSDPQIEGAPKPVLKTLPTELHNGMAELMPNREFGSLANLMVRSSATAGNKMELMVQPIGVTVGGRDLVGWDTEAFVSSFHHGTKTLNLENCTMRVHYGGGFQDTISLDLALIEGEYAVIGTVQGGDVYLVLRYTMQ